MAAAEGRVLELITCNFVAGAPEETLSKLAAMGFQPWQPWPIPQSPFFMVDASVRLGEGATISVIHPTEAASPLQRFLDKKGDGIASVTVRVDSIDRIVEKWSAAGVGWWHEEPYVFRDAYFGPWHVEVARANWTDPKSLYGLSFEAVEFQGEVTPRTDWHQQA